MSLLLVLAGLAAMAVPFIYAFCMIVVWAVVRNAKLRRAVLWVMAAVAIASPALLAFAIISFRAAEREFEALCERNSKPEILATATDVVQLLADYDLYDRKADPPTQLGRTAFPFHLANRFLLSGIDPYHSVGARALAGYELASIGADGGQQSRRYPGTPNAEYGYSWEANSLGANRNIGSGTLVVRDLRHRKVLARQAVFVFWTPQLKAFPSLWVTPSPVRQEVLRTCPAPLEIAAFLKKVAVPSVGEAGRP